MMIVNKLNGEGFSDGEIQLMRSIKPRTIMNIELVYPNIVHNEIIIGYDTYPIIVKAEGIFIHETSNYRFINSNINAFLSCLNIYDEYCKNIAFYANEDENTIIEIVKKYINQMKACDFYALSNKDFYWSIMAQQMMDGNI